MTKLEKGMLVLSAINSPLPGSPATIVYAGRGEGALFGKTLFDVFIGDMSYGYFTLRGEIATLEQAQSILLAPAGKDAEDTVAKAAVRYQFLHADDNEFYGLC